MYSVNSLIFLCVLAGIILIWFESLRIHERVVRACRNLCEKSDLQLLDQTVALSSVSVARSARGRQLRRIYQFEVSDNGMDRRKGYITLMGSTIEAVQIDDVDGMTTIYPVLPNQIH